MALEPSGQIDRALQEALTMARGLIDTATDFPYERAIDGDEQTVLTSADLARALDIVKPTVSKTALARYNRFAQQR